MYLKYKKNIAFISIICLASSVLLTWTLLRQNPKEIPTNRVLTQVTSTDKTADIVLDFYMKWLQAKESTSTDPYQLELHTSSILSPELRDTLSTLQSDFKNDIDPVLCQKATTSPLRLTARPIYTLAEKAQVLVLAKKLEAQAIVTLLKQNDGWYIDDISCSAGEFAPEREFSFEQDGYLLKKVPAPLDSNYWHLVFEQNGQTGNAVPLYFDPASVCTSLDTIQSTCDQNTFTDAQHVFVQGQMTETGVQLRTLKMLAN